jgi:5-formyltetrahydrofolate cyclo-ligase
MSDSNNSNKSAIRRDVLKTRNGMTSVDSFYKSTRIQDRIMKLEDYLSADIIGIYLPIGKEVGTWQIINHALLKNKIIVLPKVEPEHDLYFYRVDEDDLKHNLILRVPFGIKEPKGDKSKVVDDIDTLIVPGLAFDRKGSRIGYGLGYYDRYMARKKYKKSIGLCYDFQIFNRIPSMQSHDQKIDIIVSENRILLC